MSDESSTSGLYGGIRKSSHIDYIILTIRGATAKALVDYKYCCVYGSQKRLESLTASLLGRLPRIQLISSLASWPRGVGAAQAVSAASTHGALSRDRGVMASVSISSGFSQQTVRAIQYSFHII